MTTIILHSDEHSTVEELKNAISNETSGLTINPGSSNDDWDFGDPCPNCGGEHMSTMTPVEEIYRSSEGEFTYLDRGDFVGDTLNVICMGCDEELLRSPTL